MTARVATAAAAMCQNKNRFFKFRLRAVLATIAISVVICFQGTPEPPNPPCPN